MTALTIYILGGAGLALVLYVAIAEWRERRLNAAYRRNIEAQAARLDAQQKGER